MLGTYDAAATFAMAVHDDVYAVGVTEATGGRVLVHRRNEGGVNEWGRIAELVSTSPYFGYSLAMRDGVLAIGVPGDDGLGAMAGAVILVDILSLGSLDPVLVRDTIRYGAAGDRFGMSLLWIGDTLAVGAVGRSLDRVVGEVRLYHDSPTTVHALGGLPLAWNDIQLPFTRWFGAALACSGEKLAVAAPFSGTGSAVAGHNIGSLFIYERDPGSAIGWALDTAWFDPAMINDSACVFGHIELGRGGLGFLDDAIVFDHALAYSGGPGSELVPWQDRSGTLGCAPCGVRIARYEEASWLFGLASATDQVMSHMTGWTTDAGSLYAHRYDGAVGAWCTAVHERDFPEPGMWGVAECIDASDPVCDVFVAPLSVAGDRMLRLAAQRGSACDVPDGVQKLRLEMLRR